MPIIECICNEVKARGREGLLILGEVSGSLYTDGLIQKCIKFDTSAGRQFELPVAMVCPYDATLLKEEKQGEAFAPILKAHGHAIFPGAVFRLGGD